MRRFGRIRSAEPLAGGRVSSGPRLLSLACLFGLLLLGLSVRPRLSWPAPGYLPLRLAALAVDIFDLVYKAGDGKNSEISIVLHTHSKPLEQETDVTVPLAERQLRRLKQIAAFGSNARNKTTEVEAARC